MGDTYYEQAVKFAMRDFVSKVLKKYVEYLEESDKNKAEHVQKLFSEFELWLYKTTV